MMVAFGHTAIGTTMGLLTYKAFGEINPVFGLLTSSAAGAISHYITDFIPHGHFIRHRDYRSKILFIIIFDLFFGIATFLTAAFWSEGFGLRFLYIMFGIGGAQIPDILDGLIYMGYLPKKGLIKYENSFHQWLHWHGSLDKALMLGAIDIWQLSAVILALFLTLTYSI